MSLQRHIEVNRMIMALIKSKYTDLFPGSYNNPDSRYYRVLQKDNERAESSLKHGGIAEIKRG